MLALLAASLPASAAWDEATQTYYLNTSDGPEEYTVAGTVTFKAGAGSVPSWRDCGVTFHPANPGEVIIATVESIDLPGKDGNCYLLVYDDGIAAVKDDIGTYGASDGVDQSDYMPQGWSAMLDASSAGAVFTSQDPTGAMSFGFHSQSTSSLTGFTITVSSAVPGDMAFTDASFTPSAPLTRGVQGARLGTLTVNTTGINNPISIDALTLSAAGFSGTNLRLAAKGGEEYPASEGVMTASAVALKPGANPFYVVGDLDPDFTGSIDMSVQSLRVGGQDVAVPGGSVTVGPDIYMPVGPLTYTIGSDGADFYDDGGKEGNISQDFSGIVTFVPATEGKQVMADFTSLDLFNTSSVGRNDVLKVYNGRQADASALLCTLLDEPKAVKSSAADGSLTVEFRSTTGYPKSGWEAHVSEFVPVAMAFAATGAEAPAEAVSAYAGQKGVALATLRVSTTGTLAPLSLDNVEVALGGDPIASAVSVYALGQNASATPGSPCGTAQADATGRATVALSGASLMEGDNYFAIAAELAPQALNGQTLTLTPQAATVGGERHEVADAPAGSLTVENRFRHHPGTDEVHMYGEWGFQSTPDAENGSVYTLSEEDCIVTFVPEVPGAKAEISFADFDVKYSDSSYGTKAVYEIYSGRDCDAASLLWKLTSSEQSATGPGTALRSAAADGSLTVKFNAATTYSWNAGKGWHATVRPFADHAMTLLSAKVGQAPATALPGTKGQKVLTLDLTTEGTLQPLTLKGVKIDLKGSPVDAVTLASVAPDGTMQSLATLPVAADTPGQTELPCEAALADGSGNRFALLADIAASAPEDSQVDLAILSLNISGTETPVADGDPEGAVAVRRMMTMQSGNAGRVTVDAPLHFYDDGGADAPYSKGFDGAVTFAPATEGEKVKLTVNDFATSYADYLRIYRGSEATDDALLYELSGTSASVDKIISDADDGTLTVTFRSAESSYYDYDGWDITVESYTLSPLALKGVKAIPATRTSAVRGCRDALALGLALDVQGELGTASINSVDVDLSGTTAPSDIADVSVWYTGIRDGFSPVKRVATAPAADGGNVKLQFDEPIAIDKYGTYYLWLTLSADAQAAEGNTLSVAATAVGDVPVQNAAAQMTVARGFSGTYTIGPSEGADYHTFAEAIAALGSDVEGPVTFRVEAGEYAEDVNVPALNGTSASAPVLFTTASGERDVVMRGSGYDDTGAYNQPRYGIVNITAAPYVSVENFSFQPTTPYPRLVQFNGAAHHCAVRGCEFIQPVYASGSGLYTIYTEAEEKTNGTNADFLAIEDCDFTGGYIAIDVEGSRGYVAYERLHGLRVQNCRFTDCGSKAIFINQTDGLLVKGNTIMAGEAITKSSYTAIDLLRIGQGSDVCGNVIVNSMPLYSEGIDLRNGTEGTPSSPVRVYNNAISFTASPSLSSYGISISTDTRHAELAHNTVHMQGEAGRILGLDRSYSEIEGITLRNNLFDMACTEGQVFWAGDAMKERIAAQGSALISGAGNAYRSTESFEEGETLRALLGLTAAEPQFVSGLDLHLLAPIEGVQTQSVDYAATDLEGSIRHAEAPTPGAYEYAPIVPVTPEIADGYPVLSEIGETQATVQSSWNVAGTLYALALKADAPAPDEAAMLAAAASDVMAATPVTTVITGLEPQTQYVAYLMLANPVGGNSAITATAPFTTKRHIDPLTVEITAPEEANVGDEAAVSATAAGGTEPYTYAWTDRMGASAGDAQSLALTLTQAQQFTLTVTDADGNTATATAGIRVWGGRETAGFADNRLEPETAWYGHDYGDDMLNLMQSFYSGAFEFSNCYMPEYQSWTGFAYSSQTGTDFPSLFPGQFNSAAGGGVDGTPFALAYSWDASTRITPLLNKEDGAELGSVYVTNNAYAYSSMTQGDGFSEPFKEGDYLKVIFTGDDPEGTTVEYYLADMRSGADFISNQWEKVDLRPLGKHVHSVSVTFEASNAYVPTYACLDSLSYADESGIADAAATADCAVNVYTLSGLCVGHSTASLPAGIYIVERVHADGTVTRAKQMLR